jgi:hypothetical protein
MFGWFKAKEPVICSTCYYYQKQTKNPEGVRPVIPNEGCIHPNLVHKSTNHITGKTTVNPDTLCRNNFNFDCKYHV